MRLKGFLPLLSAAAFLCIHWKANAVDNEQFTINEYFELKRFAELALSSDGEMLAYVVESPSPDENNTTRTVFVSAITPGAKAVRIDKLQEGRSFAWIPETHELAYLLPVEGTVQVVSVNIKTNRSRQHTKGDFPVTAFRFSADGSSLGWLTESSDTPATLYERLFHGNEGVVVDPEHTVVYQFVDPEWPNIGARTSNRLWLKQETASSAERRQVPVPGKATSFYWSSDATKLSIAYVDSIPHARLSEKYTSLGIYDVSTGTFRSIFQARQRSKSKKVIYYAGGEWVPAESRIFVHRIEEDQLGWEQKAEWSVVGISAGAQAAAPEERFWHRTDLYGRNAEPTFLPVDEDTIYSERTIRALPSLYEIAPSGPEKAGILEKLDGAISSVRFSAEFSTVAFVNENFDRPPEIYIWRGGHGVTQLTHLNRNIADKTLPRVKQVVWQSEDGTSVQGWLLKPDDGNGKPWPLITFAHGGPTFAFTNEFAAYFSIWPYPFAAYAVNGIAAFIPNYRGTGTFGHKFENPDAIDEEPVDDIISGIDYLVAEGMADPARLGISGHSHGAWLAALVMTKENRFRAASFAEGTMNQIVLYNLMPGFLNRKVHDVLYGASLYDDPTKYIEVSPDMHFKDLDTAVMFEAGAKSLAINMMGGVKAALYAGLPAEFVIYPKTSHNLRITSLRKESAERNLDWFLFWLQDHEDPDIEKTEQYSRWRQMRLSSELRAER